MKAKDVSHYTIPDDLKSLEKLKLYHKLIAELPFLLSDSALEALKWCTNTLKRPF